MIGHQGQTASIEYELDRRYSKFEAQVGVAGQTPVPDTCHGSVILRVYVDGVMRFDSGTCRMDMPAKPVSLALNGARILKLEADSSDGSVACDQAAWGDAFVK
ncbi:MAG TPA: NPCBM/NEW2 domain-containing protein [Thermoanaerobaculia bacterium]|nr:NPCBM/NEW2 domain-containing protein [Thermoanaerobaculia bacterium]